MAAQAFERSPQGANESINAVEMGDAPRFGIPNDNARPIYRSSNGISLMRSGNHNFRAALRFFIGILERLADINFRFQCQIGSIACDISRAHVMQPPSLQLLYQIQDVARSVNVHSKNFSSILRPKRERSCAMPHFFCARCNFGARGIAQSQMRQGNVAFQYTKIFKPSSTSRTEDCFHSLSCGRSLGAPRESFHVVAILKQARRQMAADEPGCSG